MISAPEGAPQARPKEARIRPIAVQSAATDTPSRAVVARAPETSPSALVKKRNLRQLIGPFTFTARSRDGIIRGVPTPGLLTHRVVSPVYPASGEV
jgi:hypothetical protein